MKKLVLPVALVAMAALIAAAMVVDCVRLAADARSRVHLADDEMRKHEERLIDVVGGFRQVSPEVTAAIAAYRQAEGRSARHQAYQQLVIQFRQTTSDRIDPANPLDRPFMDDAAGGINRRQIAEQEFTAESMAYQQFLSSWRGALAKTFSSAARQDAAN
jgi:hypothetical protein